MAFVNLTLGYLKVVTKFVSLVPRTQELSLQCLIFDLQPGEFHGVGGMMTLFLVPFLVSSLELAKEKGAIALFCPDFGLHLLLLLRELLFIFCKLCSKSLYLLVLFFNLLSDSLLFLEELFVVLEALGVLADIIQTADHVHHGDGELSAWNTSPRLCWPIGKRLWPSFACLRHAARRSLLRWANRRKRI